MKKTFLIFAVGAMGLTVVNAQQPRMDRSHQEITHQLSKGVQLSDLPTEMKEKIDEMIEERDAQLVSIDRADGGDGYELSFRNGDRAWKQRFSKDGRTDGNENRMNTGQAQTGTQGQRTGTQGGQTQGQTQTQQRTQGAQTQTGQAQGQQQRTQAEQGRQRTRLESASRIQNSDLPRNIRTTIDANRDDKDAQIISIERGSRDGQDNFDVTFNKDNRTYTRTYGADGREVQMGNQGTQGGQTGTQRQGTTGGQTQTGGTTGGQTQTGGVTGGQTRTGGQTQTGGTTGGQTQTGGTTGGQTQTGGTTGGQTQTGGTTGGQTQTGRTTGGQTQTGGTTGGQTGTTGGQTQTGGTTGGQTQTGGTTGGQTGTTGGQTQTGRTTGGQTQTGGTTGGQTGTTGSQTQTGGTTGTQTGQAGQNIPLEGARRIETKDMPRNIQNTIDQSQEDRGAEITSIQRGTRSGQDNYDITFRRDNRTWTRSYDREGRMIPERRDNR